MIRDKLRVLEQRINAHAKLSDEEKVQMQQYVTGCYGTLTTFNILFANREDGFADLAREIARETRPCGCVTFDVAQREPLQSGTIEGGTWSVRTGHAP